mgnify:CR=1 FL=1|tara:strand:- start:77 stop:361 length:285 start_codon:yes stop_codon:yes gene_type:complete
MALTETTEYDKIEVIGEHKHVQCRKATIIKKDGVELTRAFNRYVLHPDSDISAEPAEVSAICNVVWTDAVKDAWKTFRSTSDKSTTIREDDGEK